MKECRLAFFIRIDTMKQREKISAKAPVIGGKQYHIECGPGDVARSVLIPGDPARVGKIASVWDKAREVANHREYISHAPLLWLVAGLIVFFLAESEFNRTVGLMIWLSSWSHFILDSEWGIRWLWPFSGKWFPFSDRFYEKIYSEPRLEDSNTFRYWFKLALNEYKKPQGFLEILIVITGIIVFFK